jgi:hypothetical protein
MEAYTAETIAMIDATAALCISQINMKADHIMFQIRDLIRGE